MTSPSRVTLQIGVQGQDTASRAVQTVRDELAQVGRTAQTAGRDSEEGLGRTERAAQAAARTVRSSSTDAESSLRMIDQACGRTEQSFRNTSSGAERALTDLRGQLDRVGESGVTNGRQAGRGLESGINDATGRINAGARTSGETGGGGFMEGFAGKAKLGAAAAGAAVAAVLVDAFNSAVDKRAAESKAQASLGITPEQSKQLGASAGRLYSKGYGESIAGMTDTAATVFGALGDPAMPADQFDRLVAKSSSYASAFGTDVESVTQSVSTMLKSGLAKKR